MEPAPVSRNSCGVGRDEPRVAQPQRLGAVAARAGGEELILGGERVVRAVRAQRGDGGSAAVDGGEGERGAAVGAAGADIGAVREEPGGAAADGGVVGEAGVVAEDEVERGVGPRDGACAAVGLRVVRGEEVEGGEVALLGGVVKGFAVIGGSGAELEEEAGDFQDRAGGFFVGASVSEGDERQPASRAAGGGGEGGIFPEGGARGGGAEGEGRQKSAGGVTTKAKIGRAGVKYPTQIARRRRAFTGAVT